MNFLSFSSRTSFKTVLLSAALITLSVAGNYSISAAADNNPNILTRVLLRGQKLSIRAARCDLSVVRENTSRSRFVCKKPSTNRSNSSSKGNRISLKNKQRLTVTANRAGSKKCFLAIASATSSRIELRCLKNRPTPTPTPTATVTATPTVTPTPTATPTPNANIVTDTNNLISFNTTSPGAASLVSLTGVTAGDVITSIDRRPQNGMLYGLGYNATNGTLQLYLISSQTGVATAVGNTGTFVDFVGSPVRIGVNSSTRIGMDFNPTSDQIRVVTSAGQNFRIDPNSGTFIDGNLGGGVVSGLNMDAPINGSSTVVEEVAYTNNSANSAIATVYTLDSTTDNLYIQNPPNSGTQNSGLDLGVNLSSIRGFDIPSGVTTLSSGAPVTSGIGYAVLEFASDSQQHFCSIDLPTGAVISLANITGDVKGLALQAQSGVAMIALSSDGTTLFRFNSQTPTTPTIVAVSGITSGEELVGIDFRPATGQLMGLGINATANTGSLYRINPQTGAASVVGSSGTIAFVDASFSAIDFPDPAVSGYGFNFDPTSDRIRVTTSTGLNFRINPASGNPVDGNLGSGFVITGVNPDGAINGSSTTGVSGISYTNGFAGSSVTTAYTIDPVANTLLIQNPPISGTQTSPLSLTVAGSMLDVTSIMGFEIPSEVRAPTSNTAVSQGSAFAAFTVGGSTGLYSVSLTDGVTTYLGAISNGNTPVRGLCAAQGSVN